MQDQLSASLLMMPTETKLAKDQRRFCMWIVSFQDNLTKNHPYDIMQAGFETEEAAWEAALDDMIDRINSWHGWDSETPDETPGVTEYEAIGGSETLTPKQKVKALGTRAIIDPTSSSLTDESTDDKALWEYSVTKVFLHAPQQPKKQSEVNCDHATMMSDGDDE